MPPDWCRSDRSETSKELYPCMTTASAIKKVDVLPTKTNTALARTTTIGNANELATSKTSVLELNDDCLNNIFQMLPLSDLLSLAETCSRFKAVASTVFARKHRYIDLNFNNERENPYKAEKI